MVISLYYDRLVSGPAPFDGLIKTKKGQNPLINKGLGLFHCLTPSDQNPLCTQLT